MGTTMDDIKYEMYLQEKWDDERKEVFGALEKIANSRNTNELVKNLKGLKNVYISDKPVSNRNLDKAIGGINFEMIEFIKWSKKQSRKAFIIAVIAIIVGIVGVIVPVL